MTDEEQRASDQLGGFTVKIDEGGNGDRRGMAAEIILRLGVRPGPSVTRDNLVEAAVPRLRQHMILKLAESIDSIDPHFIRSEGMLRNDILAQKA